MTAEKLYESIKQRFSDLLEAEGILNEPVTVVCRALSPEEAIGRTKRRDFPIITGKDIMIQAECLGGRGQAFTDAPASFSGTLAEILTLDITRDAHARGLFIAALNAVMESLGKCTGTIHCRTEGPELCAQDARLYLRSRYPAVRNVTLIGYQPALLEMLAGSGYQVRALDLNPANIGQTRYGVVIEDGDGALRDALDSADLILCTGSTLCNGTIVNFLDLETEVLFYGISAAGCAALFGWKRLCFADRYTEQETNNS